MSRLESLVWPGARAADAMEQLARAARLGPRETTLPKLPAGLDPTDAARWMEGAAGWLGIEAEPIRVGYVDTADIVRSAAPAILMLPSAPGGDESGGGLLALAGRSRSGRRVRLIGPDLAERWVAVEAVRDRLCRVLEAPATVEVDRMLEDAEVPPRRRARVVRALLVDKLDRTTVARGWLLRHHPNARFLSAARPLHLGRKLALLLASHTAQYALSIAGWWMVGAGALSGRLDRGWLAAWFLLLVTLIPFRLLASWVGGQFSIAAGGLIKQRLLAGALHLDPETIRHQGAGQLLGQVIESSAIEQLAIGGGFTGLVGILELGFAVLVLAAGAGGLLHAVALVAWVALLGVLAWRYHLRRLAWTDGRLQMTHELVERMVGHRTRLAQEEASRWHEGEDQSVERYVEGSRAMDASSVLLAGLIPRGWLVIGMLGLFPAFAASGAQAAGPLAIGLGGILLAYAALRKLVGAVARLSAAAIAWRQARPLFASASAIELPGPPTYTTPPAAAQSGERRLLVDAHELVFRYRDRGEPVLRGCSLQVRSGDRLLLEGPSGGGKSTLASLLVGLRMPSSGLLLLGGLDRRTLGADGWRRRVVAAPQFHENHVLSGTFAFNLLIGRAWPPEQADLDEAEAICRELGLGPLVDRMPAGLQQMVGETGWQLSHGERSRLYIARALLQDAELVVLDESFGALDPETLERALTCVLERARTLVVIAHP